MLCESIYLLLTIGGEWINHQAAIVEASRMLNDKETMRKNFFDNQRRLQQDKFTLFGAVGTTSGKDHQWREALEKLALLEEGYFPYALTFELPITDQALQKSKLDGFDYKIVPTANERYADLYLKLSDVEKYIVHRNSSGNYYRPSMYEQMPQEIRNLFYAGKVTIGVPFGQDGYVPSQVMTIPEAREFMSRKMEDRFEDYWKTMKG